ncbi:hypothetical protein ADENT20671_0766 [Actinomyces denticolens]|nr:hypothetical protein ADENT20671_0766 [Actinomyces denticolens]
MGCQPRSGASGPGAGAAAAGAAATPASRAPTAILRTSGAPQRSRAVRASRAGGRRVAASATTAESRCHAAPSDPMPDMAATRAALSSARPHCAGSVRTRALTASALARASAAVTAALAADMRRRRRAMVMPSSLHNHV